MQGSFASELKEGPERWPDGWSPIFLLSRGSHGLLPMTAKWIRSLGTQKIFSHVFQDFCFFVF